MSDRRKIFPFWAPLFFGLMSFTVVATGPRIATYRTPDVILLVMSGFLMGMALSGFIAFTRGRPRSS